MPPIHALEALHKDCEKQAPSRHSEPLLGSSEDAESNFRADLTAYRPLAYALLVSAGAMFLAIAWGLGWL